MDYLTHKAPPKREDRLKACIVYGGNLCNLADKGRKCGCLSDGKRKFEQGSICLLLPGISILNSLPDNVNIVHGAIGCGACSHSQNANARSGGMARKGTVKDAVWLSTALNESDVISGAENKLYDAILEAASCFTDGEQSALTLTRKAKNALDSASSVDSSLGEINRRFENLYYEAEDIAGEFRSYKESLAFDPQRLEEVNERLAFLNKLKKKYAKDSLAGNEEEAILLYKTNAQAEIEALSSAEENKGKLKSAISALEKSIVSKAQVLREKRTAASAKLSQLITEILKNLGMPNARFQAAVVPKQNEGQTTFGPYGAEEIEFLISANTGEPLKDLAKIASGGELSRVMLAIKTALLSDSRRNESESVETLIFDEIDAGIGGEVALKVGEYLVKIGKFKQIFCVTHLASIAVRADNHFKVEKRTEGGRTYTGIGPLSADGRRKEIARMLAGDAGTAAIAHADDLIQKYGKRSD
ncbi:DNA repair protein RecN [Treponema sp. R6D11]